MQVSGNRNLIIKKTHIYHQKKKKNQRYNQNSTGELKKLWKLELHSAGFKREQSRQRSTRITQTKSTTGKERKLGICKRRLGGERERERERESTKFGPWVAGVCFVVWLGSCDSRFRHFRQVCGSVPARRLCADFLYLLRLLLVCFLFLFLYRYVVCTYPV
jgi:hypothetical protein